MTNSTTKPARSSKKRSARSSRPWDTRNGPGCRIADDAVTLPRAGHTLPEASTNRDLEPTMRRTFVRAALPLARVATSMAVFAGAQPAAAASCTHGAPSDFNGDGVPDAAISESFPDESGGSVHILYGTRSGLTAAPSGTALDDQRLAVTPLYNSSFGTALAVGDVNGDGCTDLVVGDPTPGVNDEVESAGAIRSEERRVGKECR